MYVPETCRAKNTSIKLPSCIKLAFHFISWGRCTVKQPSRLIQNFGCFTVFCLHVVMGIFTVLKIISWRVWWSFLTNGSKKWGSPGFLMLIDTMLWIETCTITVLLWPVRSTEWRCRYLCCEFEEVKLMKQRPLQ